MKSTSEFKHCQPLQYTYLREVMKKLQAVNAALAALKKNPTKRAPLKEMIEAVDHISDLSMIHGFDGVEIISQKISSAIKQQFRSKKKFGPALRLKVESSVKAIHTVLWLEEFLERRMNVEKVERTVVSGEREIENYTQEVMQELDDEESISETKVTVVDDVVLPDNESLVFDIKEFDSVIHLTEELKEVESGEV